MTVQDQVAGSIRQDARQEVGDFILRRSDGAWAYQLAVVVDDAAMNISHVLRGADLWSSTPRQVMLQEALGLPRPQYAHVPLLVGPDGEKLSKRMGAPDLEVLRAHATDPGEVVAWLARSAGLVGPGVRRVMPRELLADFDPSTLAPDTTSCEPAELHRVLVGD